MASRLDDARVRTAAFSFLAEATSRLGDVLPWSLLLEGFSLDGQRVPLVSQQGIFKPAVLETVPLSIRTAPADSRRPRPYDDAIRPDGLLVYRYRGTDRAHRENAGLREAMRDRIPLVYLFGIEEGQYLPAWPAYVVSDDPGDLSFTIALDDGQLAGSEQDPSCFGSPTCVVRT